jgi:biopolymer transport protein ExbD
MAEVNTGGGGEQKRGKPKKQTLRVDFTPMVDMNMLLITFFMFCTSLAKPQAMTLVMPDKNKNLTEQDKSKVKESEAITLILGEKNTIYYYLGKPSYSDYTSLKIANYKGANDKNSLRSLLLSRNIVGVTKIRNLRLLKDKRQISQDAYEKQAKEIKDSKDGQVVIIKPMDKSTYKNLVDALDEMQICSIGRYAVQDLTDGDEYVVKNLQQAGALTKERGASATQ